MGTFNRLARSECVQVRGRVHRFRRDRVAGQCVYMLLLGALIGLLGSGEECCAGCVSMDAVRERTNESNWRYLVTNEVLSRSRLPIDRANVDADGVAIRQQHRNSVLLNATEPVPFSTANLAVVDVDSAVVELLGISASFMKSALAAELFGDRTRLCNSSYFFHNYGGHQFGGWSGQLGDGRAVSLGFVTPKVGSTWEISIKGAGPTPFSRRGDGRAVLQSACREFLGSVALFALGIPTQRALCVVGAEVEFDGIIRDEHYQGRSRRRAPGTVTRVVPSFFRFGTAQLIARRQGSVQLVQFAREALRIIHSLESSGDESFRPSELHDKDSRMTCFGAPLEEPTCAAKFDHLDDFEALACLLERVAVRTGSLVAAWQAAGFAHGVINTDNMSLFGISIDLNVFGFIDHWDMRYVPNWIDDESRYAFGKQRNIGWWNMLRLRDAFSGTHFPNDYQQNHETWMKHGNWLNMKRADMAVSLYNESFDSCYEARIRVRLGLRTRYVEKVQEDSAHVVVSNWLRYLDIARPDYHIASRAVAFLQLWNASSFDHRLHPIWQSSLNRTGVGISALRAFTLSLWQHLLTHSDLTCATLPVHSYWYGKCATRWKHLVLSQCPKYVMRTAQIRQLTSLAADRQMFGLIREARERLSQPYETRDTSLEYTTSDVLQCSEELGCIEKVSGVLAHAINDVNHRGAQTSCGGQ